MITDKEINRLLTRGVAEIIVKDEMVQLLKSGKKLRLKEGFDPSFPDIHLGHMVALRKLRQFQELGHQVVLIVGDWTAQIGDPSGVSVTRPMLSAEKVKSNAETYMKQFFKVVDKEKTEVRWQSEWFGKFTLADIIRLSARFTVAQMLARDDFNARFQAERPIAIVELLYPLLQAYDSVMVQADVEFGGTDQKFNFLVGRELQTMMGQKPQQCFMTPLLVGTDGSHKMSKSLKNYIGVAEPPNEIFGKVMSINDNLTLQYFELLTDVSDEELAEFGKSLAAGAVNPMDLKKRLGRELIAHLHSPKDAIEAEENFARVVQRKELPEEIRELRISFKDLSPQQREYTGIDISKLLVVINFAKSRSEANRLIEQGAVSIDGERLSRDSARLKIGSVIEVEDKFIIKAGKRRIARVINTD